MKKLSLNGKWQMTSKTMNVNIEADFPGTNFGNLIKNNVIKNPLISADEKEALETSKHDFSFVKTFNLDKTFFDYESINLVCNKVDTLCTYFINDKEVFKTNNIYIRVDKNIKQFLVEGENKIELKFSSPSEFIINKQKKSPLPPNFNGVDGIPYIRKNGCHFGWDWGPCVPYCGVLDDIEIIAFNSRISNISISQNTTFEKSILNISATNAKNIYILTPNNKKITSETNEFVIDNPNLWFTREMSQKNSQPLYSIVFENDEETITKKIGLRSLYLDRSKDEYGENFCFVLNGEKVFAKGANLIPFSAIFEDSDNSTIDYYLNLAVKSNFNMIRIWGGAEYANEYIMNKCDELGLLVWQDFCFACQLYPFYDKSFKDSCLQEIKENVLRLSLHPSMALFCGNNEIETMYSYMPKTTKLMKSYYEFFYESAKDLVENITDVSYIPTSPIGSAFLKDISSDDYGDTHMWNVWHGLKPLDYYQERNSRFLSEFGLESLPSMKSIETFAKTAEDKNLNSKLFNSHQKCTGGNEKMLFYLSEMFDFTDDFSALPYLTGIVQSECVKNATIHFRQNKGRCNGSLFWQYNDVFDCPSWSSVDFQGVPKALQYESKNFFNPLCITVQKNKTNSTIYAHNDTLTPQSFKAQITLYRLDGSIKSQRNIIVDLDKNSFKHIANIKNDKNAVLVIKYLDKEIIEFFDKPSSLPLQKAEFSVQKGENSLKITSNTLAYKVCIESDEIPQENYFSMLPGETKEIHFDKMPNSYKIVCVNNIKFNRNKLKKSIFRFTYLLKPANVTNYIYYSKN